MVPRWLRGSNNYLKGSIASCPKCLTLETLWFWRDRLEPTKRLKDEHLRRGCNSQELRKTVTIEESLRCFMATGYW
jgi:Zn ribbon nucleic-acid-binding protein